MTREQQIAELREISSRDLLEEYYLDNANYNFAEGQKQMAQFSLVIIDSLSEELQDRKDYIVANPCAHCGGRINAKIAGARAIKIEELEKEIEELKAKLEIAKKALQYYDMSDCNSQSFQMCDNAGDAARKALNQINSSNDK